MKEKISTEEIRSYIKNKLDTFKIKGIKEIEIKAKTIEDELNICKRTPMVCSAMRSCGYEYEVIYSPPKGNGTRLTFKYKL
ncbi:hypothetical protein [Fusobacterium sp.]|uniref:hypothetical protein n=1 Tax=Fusobacterium sp. TaxID=68766 RepID=UPI00260A015B|nr:hypothetical protein [Fusobacterium sp.]